jgi:hypothetical protein
LHFNLVIIDLALLVDSLKHPCKDFIFHHAFIDDQLVDPAMRQLLHVNQELLEGFPLDRVQEHLAQVQRVVLKRQKHRLNYHIVLLQFLTVISHRCFFHVHLVLAVQVTNFAVSIK